MEQLYNFVTSLWNYYNYYNYYNHYNHVPRLEDVTDTDKGNIYVISDPESEKLCRYKVGISSRSEKELLRDYRRSRPQIKVNLFLNNIDNYKNIEKKVLAKFDDNRVIGSGGSKSEWIENIDVNVIIKVINKYVGVPSVLSSSLEIDNFHEINKSDIKNDLILEYFKIKCNISRKIESLVSCKDLYEDYKKFVDNDDYTFSVQVFGKHLLKCVTEKLGLLKADVKIKKESIYYKYITVL